MTLKKFAGNQSGAWEMVHAPLGVWKKMRREEETRLLLDTRVPYVGWRQQDASKKEPPIRGIRIDVWARRKTRGSLSI